MRTVAPAKGTNGVKTVLPPLVPFGKDSTFAIGKLRLYTHDGLPRWHFSRCGSCFLLKTAGHPDLRAGGRCFITAKHVFNDNAPLANEVWGIVLPDGNFFPASAVYVHRGSIDLALVLANRADISLSLFPISFFDPDASAKSAVVNLKDPKVTALPVYRPVPVSKLINPKAGFLLARDGSPCLEGTKVHSWGFPRPYKNWAPLLTIGYIASATGQSEELASAHSFILNFCVTAGQSGSPIVDSESDRVTGVVTSKLADLHPDLKIEELYEILKGALRAPGVESLENIIYDQSQSGLAEAIKASKIREFVTDRSLQERMERIVIDWHDEDESDCKASEDSLRLDADAKSDPES